MSLLLIEQAVQLSDTLKRQVEVEDWAAVSDTEAKLVSCFNKIKSDDASDNNKEQMDIEKLKAWLNGNQVLLELAQQKRDEAKTKLLQMKNSKKGVSTYKNNG